MASGTTLYTKMKIVPPTQITSPKSGIIYFISKARNETCTLDLGSHLIEKVCSLGKVDSDDRLFLRPSAFNTNNWDVVEQSSKVLVRSNINAAAVQFWREQADPERISGTWFNFGKVPKLGSAVKSSWEFQTGFWPIEGLRGVNTNSQQRFRFSLETPFVSWVARNATHLPGDLVIFQLGHDQICLLEAETKKIALLAKGQGPIVVIPKENSTAN